VRRRRRDGDLEEYEHRLGGGNLGELPATHDGRRLSMTDAPRSCMRSRWKTPGLNLDDIHYINATTSTT